MSYAMRHAIDAYRTATTVVPPPTAVTLLLDEVLNAIALLAKNLQQGEFEQAFQSLQRASMVLRGLRQNVDLDYDHEFGEQLIEMYTNNIFALNGAFVTANAEEKFAALATGLLEFRNAWAQMTALTLRDADVLTADILGQRDVTKVDQCIDTEYLHL